MSMSRKDYVAAAEIIAAGLESASLSVEATVVVTQLANAFADHFKADNPRFRYDTFFAACGLDSHGTSVVFSA
jgi:hypothetical protein